MLSGLENLQLAGDLRWGSFPRVRITKEADAGSCRCGSAKHESSKKMGLKML